MPETPRSVTPEPLEAWLAARAGCVALVFTDVVDSTALLFSRRTLDYRALMRRHQGRARALAGEHGGRLIEARGDATFAAFPGAGGACAYAIALHGDPGAEGLAIRAGVHLGPVRSDGDALVGRHVHLAARVAERGEGREVWMSDDAKRALEAEAPDVARALTTGAHEDCSFKGVPAPCHLWRIA